MPPAPTPFSEPPAAHGARARLHQVIFEADTPGGRAFDLALIAAILLSVLLVSLETVAGLPPAAYAWMRVGEWLLTGLFTLEYALRLYAVQRPLRYARSFFGIVDLLAILPTYVSLLFPGGQYLLTVRVLRLLRVFRVLKLTHFLTEAHGLGRALRASARKIVVFLLTVATIVVIVGSLMFLVERPENGFTSIPASMYWTIVTLTTVGFGDIAPQTTVGRALASLVMLMGYGIIAIPTGIVTVELANAAREEANATTQACPACMLQGHAPDARFCRRCGHAL